MATLYYDDDGRWSGTKSGTAEAPFTDPPSQLVGGNTYLFARGSSFNLTVPMWADSSASPITIGAYTRAGAPSTTPPTLSAYVNLLDGGALQAKFVQGTLSGSTFTPGAGNHYWTPHQLTGWSVTGGVGDFGRQRDFTNNYGNGREYPQAAREWCDGVTYGGKTGCVIWSDQAIGTKYSAIHASSFGEITNNIYFATGNKYGSGNCIGIRSPEGLLVSGINFADAMGAVRVMFKTATNTFVPQNAANSIVLRGLTIRRTYTPISFANFGGYVRGSRTEGYRNVFIGSQSEPIFIEDTGNGAIKMALCYDGLVISDVVGRRLNRCGGTALVYFSQACSVANKKLTVQYCTSNDALYGRYYQGHDGCDFMVDESSGDVVFDHCVGWGSPAALVINRQIGPVEVKNSVFRPPTASVPPGLMASAKIVGGANTDGTYVRNSTQPTASTKKHAPPGGANWVHDNIWIGTPCSIRHANDFNEVTCIVERNAFVHGEGGAGYTSDKEGQNALTKDALIRVNSDNAIGVTLQNNRYTAGYDYLCATGNNQTTLNTYGWKVSSGNVQADLTTLVDHMSTWWTDTSVNYARQLPAGDWALDVQDPWGTTPPVVVPAPVLTSLSKTSVTKGAPDQTVFADGNEFVGGDRVRWGSDTLATTFVSKTRLSFVIPAAKLAAVTTASITVYRPDTGEVSATAVTFNVVQGTVGPIDPKPEIPPPAPEVAAVEPNAVKADPARDTDLTVEIFGSKFLPEDVAYWQNEPRQTTYVTSTLLRIRMLASDLRAITVGNISVRRLRTNQLSIPPGRFQVTLDEPELPPPSERPVLQGKEVPRRVRRRRHSPFGVAKRT